jgi:hypothetical protein
MVKRAYGSRFNHPYVYTVHDHEYSVPNTYCALPQSSPASEMQSLWSSWFHEWPKNVWRIQTASYGPYAAAETAADTYT